MQYSYEISFIFRMCTAVSFIIKPSITVHVYIGCSREKIQSRTGQCSRFHIFSTQVAKCVLVFYILTWKIIIA